MLIVVTCMQVPLVWRGFEESGLVGRAMLHSWSGTVLGCSSVDHDQRLPQQHSGACCICEPPHQIPTLSHALYCQTHYGNSLPSVVALSDNKSLCDQSSFSHNTFAGRCYFPIQHSAQMTTWLLDLIQVIL